MKITKDNFEDVFGRLDQEISALEKNDNRSVRDTLKKIKEKFEKVRDGGDQLKKENDILNIGVVGQVKAGKSTFLNSLFFDGENVLPKASTPMTAGLTVLKYGEENSFEVEYYNTKEWELFKGRADEYDLLIRDRKAGDPSISDDEADKLIPEELRVAKELVSGCSRDIRGEIQDVSRVVSKKFSDMRDLQDVLKDYVGADGKYVSIVKCLTLKIKDERLEGIQIVDTPGVNDPVISREERTRDFLRSCHGIFFLSFSSRFFDSTDVQFLTDRIGSQGIGTVVLIASKFDSVLQDVGLEFKDDLSAAIDDCERNLKKQYRNNIGNAEFRGEDPIMNVSSGIGFSIHKKPRPRWDSEEAHTVERMQSFYPSFFQTDDDIKSTFNELSRIDIMRDEYLEKTFKQNKEKIIREKVDSYFSNSASSLEKIISEEKKRLQDKLTDLKASDLSVMQEKRDVLTGIIEKMKNNIQSIINRIDNMSEKYQKECLNSLKFDWDGRIPVQPKTQVFIRLSTFWKSQKAFACTYDAVDPHKLIEDLCKSLEGTLGNLTKNWEDKYKILNQKIVDEFSEIITQGERDDTTGRLNADILRNILTETVEAMSNKATLEIYKIEDEFRSTLSEHLSGKIELPYSLKAGGENEQSAKYSVQQAAELCKGPVVNVVNSIIRATLSDCQGELRRASGAIRDILNTRKSEFFDNITASTKDYLNNLEHDLKDKESQVGLFDEAISGLTTIGTIL